MKCPKCGSSAYIRIKKGGFDSIITTVFKCEKCGHRSARS